MQTKGTGRAASGGDGETELAAGGGGQRAGLSEGALRELQQLRVNSQRFSVQSFAVS